MSSRSKRLVELATAKISPDLDGIPVILARNLDITEAQNIPCKY